MKYLEIQILIKNYIEYTHTHIIYIYIYIYILYIYIYIWCEAFSYSVKHRTMVLPRKTDFGGV